MKKSLALAFAAVALSAGAALATPVAALAAGDITTQNGVQIAQAIGRSNDHAAGSQDAYAWLSYQNGVYLMPSFPAAARLSSNDPLPCATCALVNATGGER
jgi:hypothetical protein